MAAGRDGVWRRREFYRYNSEKEYVHYRDGSAGAEVHRSHITYNNGRRSSWILQNSGSGQKGFYSSKEGNEREQDRVHSKFHAVSGGTLDDNDAWEPPEKRRKFSPVAWDLEEKEGRLASKQRITQVTSPSPAQVSPPSIQGATGARDGIVSRLKSPPDFSSALPQKQSGNVNLDVDNLEKDCTQRWDITMSRWANVHSPGEVSDDENMPSKENLSMESGEIRIESSVGKSSVSSGSSGDHYTISSSEDAHSAKGFHGSDSMDVECGETSCISNSLSDSDDSCGLRQVRRNIDMLHSCRSVCEFEMIKKINEGTYGVVYKAKDKKTGEIVALKKVKMNIERDGFPMSSLREMNILLSLNHPSIVDVKEVVVDDFDGTFMVMEHMEYDLKGLMDTMKQPFSIGEIKSLMWQLLEGVKYLHDNWVLHRDLKTSNILLNKECELKICDFGLSRQYGSPLKPYTSVVVTLWYRAPELLLGAKEYSTAIDMWSVGCIMAELVAKEALFKGKTEVEQLDKIFQTLGTPDEKIWPGLSKLPGSKAKFVKQPYSILRKKFPAASFTGSPVLSELGFDLLSKLLTYNPEQRITAESALLHDWFHEEPLPKSDFGPVIPSRCG